MRLGSKILVYEGIFNAEIWIFMPSQSETETLERIADLDLFCLFSTEFIRDQYQEY